MKRYLSVAAAVAILCSAAAPGFTKTTTIDFENVDQSNAPFAPLLTGGDYVTQDGYIVESQEADMATGSLVGALINGADAGSCLNGLCPTGNATNYIGALNDGIIAISKMNGDSLGLLSFDAAFLATPDEASSSTSAYLAIEADRADGSYAVNIFNLGPLVRGSATAFQNFQTTGGQFLDGTGSLTSGDITSYFAYAYYCNPVSGSCSAFQTNNGQFALDNLVFAESASTAPVPEPAAWAMMIGGLGFVGAALRRRVRQVSYSC